MALAKQGWKDEKWFLGTNETLGKIYIIQHLLPCTCNELCENHDFIKTGNGRNIFCNRRGGMAKTFQVIRGLYYFVHHPWIWVLCNSQALPCVPFLIQISQSTSWIQNERCVVCSAQSPCRLYSFHRRTWIIGCIFVSMSFNDSIPIYFMDHVCQPRWSLWV